VIVTNATVTDAAYVMQALGARDALNLDGGGTAAMWIGGSYKVGPGRLLPNAVILTKP
jgi:exopolysaccharide biosynthesis protein